MVFDEHDEWFSGFGSWEEVLPPLQDEWTVLRDDRQRLEVSHGGDGLVVYEWPGERLRARQRRSLHRLGFRLTRFGRLVEWAWDVEAVMAVTDLAAYETQYDDAERFLRPATFAMLRRRAIRNELIAHQAQRVLHEVFRSMPGDIAVAVYREPDLWAQDWDEEDDESWSQV